MLNQNYVNIAWRLAQKRNSKIIKKCVEWEINSVRYAKSLSLWNNMRGIWSGAKIGRKKEKTEKEDKSQKNLGILELTKGNLKGN